jgi:hypothetical protein
MRPQNAIDVGAALTYNALTGNSSASECRRRTLMSTGTDISALYREFTDALTEVLAENAVGPERRGRLARARAAITNAPSVQ